MKKLIVYRILTYLLLAIAGVISFFVFGGLMAALANPVMLFFVFLMVCVVIYSYCSFRFLSRGIDAHMYCKPALRDLIRRIDWSNPSAAGRDPGNREDGSSDRS